MDTLEKVDLVSRPPTEEVVTREELQNLFETKSHPRHYIGLEISGFLHLGSLFTTGFKINDLLQAGVDCTVFLADWHTLINDKMGGSRDLISRVSRYYSDAFKLVCPGVRIILGSDLYESRREYWYDLVRITKHMSLARTMRTLTIMGRTEGADKVDLSKLLYPPMQAADIHFLEADIAHAGMDQRKIHMLAREVFPKMGWDVPVALHHRLLPGFARRPDSDGSKMSKTDPGNSISVHDTDDHIRTKIRKAWCEPKDKSSPLLAVTRDIIFHRFGSVTMERPAKFGGDITFGSYDEMEAEFGAGSIHPMDLKQMISQYLVEIVGPIRDRLALDDELIEAIRLARSA